ncbi:MAG: hypothetical protein NT027_20150, partial [Proteobacteria bacterium]|nr:hypothetical protein [Pseudomonadota bacterium]
MDKEYIDKAIAAGRQWLTYQGPIKDLVCQNPLTGVQPSHTFYSALLEAQSVLGTYFLMSLDFYQNEFACG